MDDLDRLVMFIREHIPYDDIWGLKEALRKHIEFNTLYCMRDYAGNIIALCRWNIEDNGYKAHILDLIISPNYRRQGIAKEILQNSLRFWSDVIVLEFERGTRGEKRKRMIKVSELLKRNIF